MIGAVIALALATAPTPLPAVSCSGTLSGSVTGAFTCDASLVDTGAGAFALVLAPRGPIEGVPAYAPGSFELPGKPAPGTFTLATLGPGRASVAAEGGTLYTATKTSSQRGEVTLVLTSVRREGGRLVVHGTYRARLIPAGGGKTGEVVVEASF